MVNLDSFSVPRHHPHPALISSLPGQNSQFSSFAQKLRKNGFIFSERPGFPAAPRRFCEGFRWGWHGEHEKQTEGVGQGQGEDLLGKTLFFGIFSYKFQLFRCPRRRENEGMAGGMAWGAEHKKEDPGT